VSQRVSRVCPEKREKSGQPIRDIPNQVLKRIVKGRRRYKKTIAMSLYVMSCLTIISLSKGARLVLGVGPVRSISDGRTPGNEGRSLSYVEVAERGMHIEAMVVACTKVDRVPWVVGPSMVHQVEIWVKGGRRGCRYQA
jgi:hypothetical protein